MASRFEAISGVCLRKFRILRDQGFSEHARLVVDRPEIKDQQAGFEALGGRCESCGTCDESCLKKLGLEHEDGSRSPSSISPKAEKMYTFFEKSLSLLHERRAEDHLLRTVNLAASNAVLSRITARLKAVTNTQESVEEVDEEVERSAAAAMTKDAVDQASRARRGEGRATSEGATPESAADEEEEEEEEEEEVAAQKSKTEMTPKGKPSMEPAAKDEASETTTPEVKDAAGSSAETPKTKVDDSTSGQPVVSSQVVSPDTAAKSLGLTEEPTAMCLQEHQLTAVPHADPSQTEHKRIKDNPLVK
ncbi:cytochrome c1-like [Penaeus chinensis]|uniref:cytochrome c1-like n=1 Tax=Penaeus chinensis TaxID=139456 RepID=UPI001FB713E1|nr:cytochrome c1-like [Penaeus chinensis]